VDCMPGTAVARLAIYNLLLCRCVIQDASCKRSSKIKPMNVSELKAILENNIAKILKIA